MYMMQEFFQICLQLFSQSVVYLFIFLTVSFPYWRFFKFDNVFVPVYSFVVSASMS